MHLYDERSAQLCEWTTSLPGKRRRSDGRRRETVRDGDDDDVKADRSYAYRRRSDGSGAVGRETAADRPTAASTGAASAAKTTARAARAENTFDPRFSGGTTDVGADQPAAEAPR